MLKTLLRRAPHGPPAPRFLQNAAPYATATKPNQPSPTPIDMAYSSYESTGTLETPDGPAPLLIMHGLFGSKGNWNSLGKALLQKSARKIIAVDARNHGESPHTDQHTYQHLAHDVKHFFERHGIKKATVMGHSMGGRAMMYFALKFPHLVDKLVVVDISPIKTSPTLHSMPALFDVMRDVKLPTSGNMSTARLAVDKQMTKKIQDKGLRAFLLTNLVQKSNGGYEWRINLAALVNNFADHIATFPAIDGGARFDGPTLFIGGGASDYIPKSDHVGIAKLFPKVEFRYVNGAGHWLHSEKPNEFLTIVIEFVNANSRI